MMSNKVCEMIRPTRHPTAGQFEVTSGQLRGRRPLRDRSRLTFVACSSVPISCAQTKRLANHSKNIKRCGYPFALGAYNYFRC